MRPIEKGSWPTKGKQLIQCVFNDWTTAIPHLKARTGYFCHLCEGRFDLTIEHILSRLKNPTVVSDWHNFILVCRYCNSRKSQELSEDYPLLFFWPHLHNTMLAFDYNLSDLGRIAPHPKLQGEEVSRSQSTINLYSLSSATTAQGRIDERFKRRSEVLLQAITRLEEYQSEGRSTTVKGIVDAATNTGFFSIWLKVFEDLPEVRSALINCPDFHLAGKGFFDQNGIPIPRNGQAI